MKYSFFGQYLLSEGIVTAPQLTAAVERQEQFNSRLGEYAVALGCITPFEAQKVNALQAERDLKFGEAAMELGLFDNAQLQAVIKKQRNEHLLLGEALSGLGYVEQETITQAFSRFLEQSQDDVPSEVPADHSCPELAHSFFANVHQLLFRAWSFPNKARPSRTRRERVLLSDRNALMDVTGDRVACLALGVPHDIIRRVAGIDGDGHDDADEQACGQAVREFLNRVGQNVKAALAEEGCQIELAPAKSCTFRIGLADTRGALVVPHVTHDGQVIAALIT